MDTEPHTDGARMRGRARRRELAARQAWWFIGGAVLVVGAGRLATRTLDPVGPDRLDWALTLVHALEFQIGCVIVLLLVGALIRRDGRQVLATGVLVAVTVLAPLAHRYAANDSHALKGEPLTVLSINMLVSNDAVAPTARTIRRARPDVILVQEYAPPWHKRLPALLEDEYELLASEVRYDSFGSAAFVRKDGPLDAPEARTWHLDEADTPQVEVDGRLADDEVKLLGVHLLPPIGPEGMTTAHADTRQVTRRAKQHDGPLVVAGDFNAVGGSAIDQSMQREGLHDAWDIAGRGAGWTYPEKGLGWVPGVRIDHVYVSDDWQVLGARLLDANGSDHRPLLVELALRPG